MAVSIQFLGVQRHMTNTDSIDMPITGETKVSDAIEYIRQKYPNLHLDDGMIIAVVNLETASLDRILRDNDTVSFLPVIGGG
jgi:molybdopterin converting factor small subunit